MSSRILLPLTAGFIIGSSVTFFYNPRTIKHKLWDWNWDGRHAYYLQYLQKGQQQDPPIKPKGQRTITLIRHSQYNRIQGEINDDRTLTQVGIQQAQLTGQRLRDLDMKFDKIYASGFTRAQQTCQYIVEQLPHNDCSEIIYDSDLNEGLATIIEPYAHYKSREQFIEGVKQQSPVIVNAFSKYFHRRNMEDMDPNNSKQREDILIVGHANVFRYWLTRCLQFDTVGWARFGLTNCSISRIYIFDDGRIQVTHIGDTGHLPEKLLTGKDFKDVQQCLTNI
eukprot:312980_1